MTDPALSRQPELVVGTLQSRRLARLRGLSRLLDSSLVIPGTRFRFGLDALVGLVPGLGDIVGAMFSAYIVFEAARMGVPRPTLIRMIGNVGIDTLVGEIPVLGDLFDVAWKSNIRNLVLLERHLQGPAAGRAASRRVLLLAFSLLLLLLVVVVALGVIVANYVLELLK